MQEKLLTFLLITLVVMFIIVHNKGGLRQCQDNLARTYQQNYELQRDLARAYAENKQLREDLKEAIINRKKPDLFKVRENLLDLLHEKKTSLWDCDRTANGIIRIKEMPFAEPNDMVREINKRYKVSNTLREFTVLVLKRIEEGTAIVDIKNAHVVTQQMGSTGASCYFAGATFSLTSFKNIDRVRFDIEPGDHGGPGTYMRTSFIAFLPLWLE